MVFAYPVAFGLFVLLPQLTWWYVKKHNSSQATFTVSTTHSFGVSSGKNKLRHLPFILRLLTLSCIIIALARPQKRNEEQRSEGEGIDIVLCMDVSGSMGSRDILPSRMDVAKEVAEEFVRSRPVDRIGLVIFSGESFTQCPVTTDRNTLITQIQSLESRKYLKDGTVIGEGLATAADRLQKSTAKSKVIILITDGKEDPPDTRLIDPLTALEITKTEQIKVYTIGIGAMPSTIVELTGNKTKQPNANIDFIDEALPRKIAEEPGVQAVRARPQLHARGPRHEAPQRAEVLLDVRGSLDHREGARLEEAAERGGDIDRRRLGVRARSEQGDDPRDREALGPRHRDRERVLVGVTAVDARAQRRERRQGALGQVERAGERHHGPVGGDQHGVVGHRLEPRGGERDGGGRLARPARPDQEPGARGVADQRAVEMEAAQLAEGQHERDEERGADEPREVVAARRHPGLDEDRPREGIDASPAHAVAEHPALAEAPYPHPSVEERGLGGLGRRGGVSEADVHPEVGGRAARRSVGEALHERPERRERIAAEIVRVERPARSELDDEPVEQEASLAHVAHRGAL